MKINYERTPGFCTFESLSYGDCFIFNDEVFMTVNSCHCDDSNVALAVSLETGKLCGFCEDEDVIPVEAEVIVK